MSRSLAIIAMLGACGRVGFSERERLDGGSADASIDAPPCAVSEWTASITRVANLSVNGSEDWEPAVSPDGTTMVFASFRASNESELYVTLRATPDDDFANPTRIPGFGSLAGTDVVGPAWSLDGSTLYYTSDVPREVDYLGNGQFGTPRASDLPGDSVAFASVDDVYTTTSFALDDYDLEHWTRAGGAWVKQSIPPAYTRHNMYESDGWPTLDLARNELYFEHETAGDGVIVRARLDAAGALPATFEVLGQLGSDLGDPDLSLDGLRMYVGSRRRDGTDNDIYMFERSCQ